MPEPPPHRLPALAAAVVTATATLAFYKLVLLAETAALADLSVRHFTADAVTGGLLALGALLHERLRAALLYAAIALYVISIHTLIAFGGFVDIVALSFLGGFADMTDNARAALRWELLLTAPLVGLVSWWAQRRLRRRLATFRPRALGIALGAWAAVLVLLAVVPGGRRGALVHQNPLGYLLASVLFHLDEALTPPAPSEPFSPISPFPSPPPEPLAVTPAPGVTFNIILLMLESTGAVSLGDASERTMPTFWRLAENGAYFPNAYANLPMSMKAIFALHAGQDPAANWVGISESNPRIDRRCLPAFFAAAGYRTALLHGGHFAFYRKDLFLADRGYDLLHDGHDLPNRAAYDHTSWGIDDRAIFDFGREWIAASPEPFLLTLIPILPHAPYVPPGDLAAGSHGQHAWYFASIHYIDSLLAELIDDLDRQGRLADTIIVAVGDHGEAFEQHPGNVVHSLELYEENLRVPLLIANRRLFPAPQRNSTLVRLGDLLPTLLDLTGVAAEGFSGDGVSLLRPLPNRMIFFYTGMAGEKLGLRDGDFKYILRTAGGGRSELYDLSDDPGEQHDRAAAELERVTWYRRQVRRWKAHSRAAVAP